MESNEIRLCLHEIIDLLREINEKIVPLEQDKKEDSVPEQQDTSIKDKMREQVDKGYDPSKMSDEELAERVACEEQEFAEMDRQKALKNDASSKKVEPKEVKENV